MLMCQYVVVGADACIRPRVDASIDPYSVEGKRAAMAQSRRGGGTLPYILLKSSA